VSLFKTGQPVSEHHSLGDRARDVAAQAIPQARRAGTQAVQGVMHGVEGARGWAAPRMHNAADAFSETLAPKVSSAMHTAATSVDTTPQARSGIARLLNWRVLLGIGAAIAAAGAAAVTLKRYQSATEDAKDGADSVADAADSAADAVRDGSHRAQDKASSAASGASDKLKAAADKVSAAADKVREAAHR
jgi:uncharacterized phage infection (PIP) family protein YhgE